MFFIICYKYVKLNNMIINITHHKHSENVIEIMFHSINNDWFISLFPKSDVDFVSMKNHYIGKDFYETKKQYEGKIFAEGDFV